KSKAGKRFAFVRFIKVENIDRLVAPAMVIDDSCVVTCDLEFFVMGKVKKFSSIPNLRVLLSNEGFQNVKVVSRVEYCTDDESVQGTNEDKGKVSNKVQPNPESDDEGVFDTYFGESEENLGNEHNSEQPMNDKEKSQDPFNFYYLFRKRDGGVDTLGSDISIPYPPGFTPEKLNNNADVHEVKDMNTEPSECRSEGLCSRVLEEVQHTDDLLSSGVRSNGHTPKKEGSVLEVLDEMIKVGQTMGYTMACCMKDIE
nr:RNA-directed DNA polymerase, eukaryota [Tanacetum cinerariifolium]